jgi:hypothetical protein
MSTTPYKKNRRTLLDLIIKHLEQGHPPYSVKCEDGYNIYARTTRAHLFLGHVESNPQPEIDVSLKIWKKLMHKDILFRETVQSRKAHPNKRRVT